MDLPIFIGNTYCLFVAKVLDLNAPLDSIVQVLPKEVFRTPDSSEQLYIITNFIELTPVFESVSKTYEFKKPSDFVHQYYKSPMKEVM